MQVKGKTDKHYNKFKELVTFIINGIKR